MLVAVDLPDGVFEVVEVPAAGIRLVAEHHPGPLAIAHRRGAGVGEEVDVDVLAPQQEGVVAGLADRDLALLARGHLDGLDHLDLVGLRPTSAARVCRPGHLILLGSTLHGISRINSRRMKRRVHRPPLAGADPVSFRVS